MKNEAKQAMITAKQEGHKHQVFICCVCAIVCVWV